MNPNESDAIDLVNGDALEVDRIFPSRAFDYAHTGMFLHHLAEPEALAVLRSMDRVSRMGLVWNDLSRSRLSLLAVKSLTMGRAEMIRHDAVVSVRKGFTRAEVVEMARQAGLAWCRYEHSFWAQRFTLAGKRAEARSE